VISQIGETIGTLESIFELHCLANDFQSASALFEKDFTKKIEKLKPFPAVANQLCQPYPNFKLNHFIFFLDLRSLFLPKIFKTSVLFFKFYNLSFNAASETLDKKGRR
jgi:hypothetical protein